MLSLKGFPHHLDRGYHPAPSPRLWQSLMEIIDIPVVFIGQLVIYGSQLYKTRHKNALRQELNAYIRILLLFYRHPFDSYLYNEPSPYIFRILSHNRIQLASSSSVVLSGNTTFLASSSISSVYSSDNLHYEQFADGRVKCIEDVIIILPTLLNFHLYVAY